MQRLQRRNALKLNFSRFKCASHLFFSTASSNRRETRPFTVLKHEKPSFCITIGQRCNRTQASWFVSIRSFVKCVSFTGGAPLGGGKGANQRSPVKKAASAWSILGEPRAIHPSRKQLLQTLDEWGLPIYCDKNVQFKHKDNSRGNFSMQLEKSVCWVDIGPISRWNRVRFREIGS